MKTITRNRLWINQNTGEVTCDRHGGSYLKGAIMAAQVARRHVTPLGTWLQVNRVERDWWREEFGVPMACETCGVS